jgi:hypothetical protein
MTAISDQVNDKRPRLIHIIIFGCSFVLVLMGCSNKHGEWQNFNKSRIFWCEDILRCKSLSKTHLARQLDIVNDTDFNNKTDLQIQFVKYDAVKKFNFYYADCMTDAGYDKILKND